MAGFEVTIEAVDGPGVKYLLPPLGDEDQVNMELTDALPTVSNIT
jgi:hypothetical protein